jgi:beta-glucanase (GH16 family)
MAIHLACRSRDVAGMVLMVLMFVSPLPALAGADTPPLTETPGGRPLSLAFSDNFQTFRPWTGHSGVWRTTFGDGSQAGFDRRSLPNNGALELDVDDTVSGLHPFTVAKGGLEITAPPTPPAVRPEVANYSYVSGLITTQPSFSQTYGYFEMRAELPQGKGLWPAFWLLPRDQSWPPEIDVVESVGNPGHVYMTAHSKVAKSEPIEAHVAPNAFHSFAVSWDPQNIIWYVDGVEAGRVPTPGDMHKPMYMLANLAVGGHWPGAPDATADFPAKLTIDYIRAYRFAR